jgi:hypothetical protein
LLLELRTTYWSGGMAEAADLKSSLRLLTYQYRSTKFSGISGALRFAPVGYNICQPNERFRVSGILHAC